MQKHAKHTYISVLFAPAKGNGSVRFTWSNPSSLGRSLWSPGNPNGKKDPRGTPRTCITLQMTTKTVQQAPTGQPLRNMFDEIP